MFAFSVCFIAVGLGYCGLVHLLILQDSGDVVSDSEASVEEEGGEDEQEADDGEEVEVRQSD